MAQEQDKEPVQTGEAQQGKGPDHSARAGRPGQVLGLAWQADRAAPGDRPDG